MKLKPNTGVSFTITLWVKVKNPIPPKRQVLVFRFKNGGYLAITFLLFLMKLFLLPTERNNKILKSKYFGSVSKDVSVVCRTTRR